MQMWTHSTSHLLILTYVRYYIHRYLLTCIHICNERNACTYTVPRDMEALNCTHTQTLKIKLVLDATSALFIKKDI